MTAEREKILVNAEMENSPTDQVVISGLSKYFGSHKAVNGIYLSIPRGECFGLLGKYTSHLHILMYCYLETVTKEHVSCRCQWSW